MVVEIPFNILHSQVIQTKPTRQSSFEAFSLGNYNTAYTQFRELLLTYSKDPLYKYYAGVCLVKMSKDPDEAMNLLQQAIQGADAVKTLPSDGLFYLGRAQQMSGKYPEASESYNLYSHQVGKRTAREMGVPEFLQQCTQGKGKLAVTEVKPVESLNTVKADTIRTVVKEPIQKATEKQITTTEELPTGYEKLLNEAINFQFKSDSLLELAGEQRKDLEKPQVNEKVALKTKISDNEKLSASFQKLADQKYSEYQAAINPPHDTVRIQKLNTEIQKGKHVNDSVKIPDNKFTKVVDKKSDTPKVIIPVVKPKVETFAFFEIMTKPESDPKSKIIIDPEVPEGLIYRIQIAVFRNPVVPAFFKGIRPIYGFKIAGTDKTVYYAGMFRKSSDATKALLPVKNKGFKDAFIVSLSGGKSVSSDRATLLEKEWGNKPFVSIEKDLSVNKADTIPPTLIFRVEVTRSQKPLKDDVVDEIRKMSGNRGLDIQTVENGEIAYLIGKFITFDSAAEYSDLLKRNGYKETQVVAWLGKKEIPIDTARQLFDNLK